jgi:serine protease Do
MQLERKITALAVAGALLAIGATWQGASPVAPLHAATQPASALAASPTVTPAAPAAMAAMALPDFASIVDRYGPAVVNISVSRKAQAVSNEGANDPMLEFFRRFQGMPPAPRNGQQVMGQGSGFVVAADGVILTNAHVVRDATEVTVKLTDRREFRAKVIGTDARTDVAVLKIEASGLPTVRMGDPSAIRTGEWVVAIGSPFGFENSVTAGIVSAKGRSLPDENLVPFIQTDVAVNPGNSGGPLFNLKGEVVGINSQIYSQSGGYQGLSFAIPIDMALKVKDQLQAKGFVSRARLGVTVQEVNQALADSFGLARPTGALVAQVEDGGPAAKAGVRSGDVILSVNGKAIERSADLPAVVADAAPGSSARIEVMRSGKPVTLEAKYGEMKDRAEKAAASAPVDGGKLGLAVRPLTPEERSQSGLAAGLVVQDVAGPAARAGLQPGDVVLSLNGESVKSATELRDAAQRAGKRVALLVQRGEGRLFIPLNLG